MAQTLCSYHITVFYGDDKAAKAKLVDDVRKCCLHNGRSNRKTKAKHLLIFLQGFFQIVGHHVPGEVQEDVLHCLKAFFALPQAEKEKVHKGKPDMMSARMTNANLNSDNTTWNRGYENLGSQILEIGANPDQKEGFYVGEEISKDHPYFVGKKLNSGPNQWPQNFPDAEKFRTASMIYYSEMHKLAKDVLSVVAQTLDLDANYFETFTDGAVATLRYLHYPPQAPDSDEKLSRGIGAHTDFGSVTLLMQDDVDGLQVWEKSTEEWLDVSSSVQQGLGNVSLIPHRSFRSKELTLSISGICS
jgi:isopenicillin N synthase-like dioxygenase